MKILGLIPARGGSKGIPRKNIKHLLGKPLIAWTIEAALKSLKFDSLVVSTEDDEIAEVARAYGADVPFMRPAELARDSTPGIFPVLHAIEKLPDFDLILLLQPTSPLRTSGDIVGIIDFALSKKVESVVSICESPAHPHSIFQLIDTRLSPILSHEPAQCRQNRPKAFSLNGALYLAKPSWVLSNQSLIESDSCGYVMPKSRSYDIDDEEDWIVCEHLLSRQLNYGK